MVFARKKSENRLIRRCFLVGPLLLLAGVSAYVPPGTAAVGAEISLTARPQRGSLVRVKTIVEVEGSLHSSAKESSDQLPMKVRGESFYDEIGLTKTKSLRHYWTATADLHVDKDTVKSSLRASRQLVLVDRPAQERSIFSSPQGPLMREELELMDIAGSGVNLADMLPRTAVSPGDTWKHPGHLTARLLTWDSIASGELTSKLSEVTEKVAKIELSGTLTGKVDGVETTIEVVGNYDFDRQDRIVTWLTCSLRENRKVGFSAPGYNAVTRIRTARQAIRQSDALPSTVTKQVSLKPDPSNLLLEFTPASQMYRMYLDRRWHVLAQQRDSAAFRLVDEGDLLATCKIHRLDPLSPGKRISLPDFQDDVRRALADNCQGIVQTEESENSHGLHVLRVVAVGQINDVKVQWIYYHLSGDDGRRLSCIFTQEASMAKRVAGMDEALTNSLMLTATKQAQRSTAHQTR